MKIGDVVRGKAGTLLEGYRGVVIGFNGDDCEFVAISWIGREYSSDPLVAINPSCLEVETSELIAMTSARDGLRAEVGRLEERLEGAEAARDALQRELQAAMLFLHELSHAPHMRKEHGARLERYANGLGRVLDALK